MRQHRTEIEGRFQNECDTNVQDLCYLLVHGGGDLVYKTKTTFHFTHDSKLFLTLRKDSTTSL